MGQDLDSNNRQKIFSEIDKNFLVEASAGSGKTASLVTRMIKMVESGIPIDKIVTITFTKKAANEFYDRFNKDLIERSNGRHGRCHLNYLPNLEQQARDKEALKNIDLCFMGTIDSFCYSILKEHPFEAELPSNLTLVEDTNKFAPIYKTIFNFIKKDSNPLLTEELFFFETFFSKEDQTVLINHFIENREYEVKNYSTEQREEDLNTFQREFNNLKSLLTFISDLDIDLEKITKKEGRAIFTYLKANPQSISDINFDDFSSIKKLFKHLTKLNENLVFKKDSLNINAFAFPYKNYFDFDQKGKIVITFDFESLNNLFTHLVFARTISFLNSITLVLSKALRDKGLLSFSDVMIYLNNALKNPLTWEKIRTSILKKHEYYLIDEFQDTSPTQMELFLRLTSENYFKNNEEEARPKPGTLFLVGDPKQSIYRFRGADFQSYNRIKNIFIKQKIGEVLPLERNYRSRLEVKKYLNNVFHTSKDILYDNEPYQTSCPRIPEENSKDEKKEEIFGTFKYQRIKKEDDYKKVANIVKNLININGYKPNDFMIILKSKSHLYDYKAALEKLGIPAFVEGQIFFKTTFIQNLIALFIYLVRQDETSLAKLFAQNIFKTKIQNLSLDYEKEIKEKIDFENLPKPDDYKNPAEFLEVLLNSSFLKEYCGNDELPNAIFLIESLKEKFLTREIITYEDAVDFLDSCFSNKNTIERISSLNDKNESVKIANLHKVKGLESNIVILASPSEKEYERNLISSLDHETKTETIFNIERNGKFQTIIISNDRAPQKEEKRFVKAENERLLYVAATRAKNLLIICQGPTPEWDRLITSDFKNLDEKYLVNNTPTQKFISYSEDPSILNEEPMKKTFNNLLPSKLKATSKKDLSENEFVLIKEDTARHGFVNKQDSALIGTMVHKLMEMIIKNKTKKLDEKICQAIAFDYNGTNYEFELMRVLKQIYEGGFDQTEVDNPFEKDIFSKIQSYECFTETPFSYMEGDNLIFGVIDLILVKEDEAIIIDYKTDNDISKTDHSKQLEIYQKTLLKENPSLNVKAFIYSIPIKK